MRDQEKACWQVGGQAGGMGRPPPSPHRGGPAQQWWCGASVKWTTSPCLTHSLCGQHVIDGVVILLCQDGQLTGLLILQSLQHGLVVRLGRVLQQVVAQRLVLAGLDLAGVLELTLYLQLLGLEEWGERWNSWERALLCFLGTDTVMGRVSAKTMQVCASCILIKDIKSGLLAKHLHDQLNWVFK